MSVYIRRTPEYFRRFGQGSNPDFVFTVRTTSDNETFTIPTYVAGSYDCTISYGDGTADGTMTAWGDDSRQHEYAVAGDYTITVSGLFTRMRFNNLGDKLKIIDVSNWGANIWDSDQLGAFYGCLNMTVTATDEMNVSSVTNMQQMFRGCESMTSLITTNWDVSNVTTMVQAFRDCSLLSVLDTSLWDVTSLTNLFGFLEQSELANPDVSNWVTTSLTSIGFAFRFAFSANPDVSGWDVSGVTSMQQAFEKSAFSGIDLSSWDTSSLTNLLATFQNATSADPDVSGFDVTGVTTAAAMFNGSGFSQTNYDLLLVAWEAQAVQDTVSFHAGSAKYGAGAPATARADLIADNSWSITDGGPA